MTRIRAQTKAKMNRTYWRVVRTLKGGVRMRMGWTMASSVSGIVVRVRMRW